jgi:hypothetical protein
MKNKLRTRYAAIDDYTLEELIRTYGRSTPGQRCRLLRRLQAAGKLQAEIAFLAVKDSSTEVREWFARFGDFSPLPGWRAKEEAKCDWGELISRVHRELRTVALSDPDPFVRACLRENPSVFGAASRDVWMDYFNGASHMERLALVRNKGVGIDLVGRIANLEDAELGIDLRERSDLMRAFLSNEDRLHTLKDEALLCEEHEPGVDFYSDGWGMSVASSFLASLWRQTSKWPIDTGIHRAVYASVAVSGEVKAEVYRSCSDTGLKLCILDTCHGRQGHRTIELAVHDADEGCREAAYSKMWAPGADLVRELLERGDRVALAGLARNASVPVEPLLEVKEWFRKNYPEDDLTWNEIRRNLASRRAQTGAIEAEL